MNLILSKQLEMSIFVQKMITILGYSITNDLGIKPSNAFFDGVPDVLTCRELDKGSNEFNIHPP